MQYKNKVKLIAAHLNKIENWIYGLLMKGSSNKRHYSGSALIEDFTKAILMLDSHVSGSAD
jgi:hypothetical protein